MADLPLSELDSGPSTHVTLSGENSDSPQAPGEACTLAIKKFSARLTGEELAEFKSTTYEQLCSDLDRVQNEQASRMEMKNLSRIKSCLEAMHQFAKVFEIFSNVSDAVAFIWGPMKLLLLTASMFAEPFEALVDAYEQIGEQLPLISEYEALFQTSPHMINVLELMYIDILDFHSQALKIVSGRLWKVYFKYMWKDFNTKFGGILESLSRHKDIVECHATVSQYREYRENIADLELKLHKTIEKEQAKKMMKVKDWLAVGEQQQNDHASYSGVRKECVTTTRWVLQHETIKHWMDADVPITPTVWMHGIPGAGKTILASAIIDECRLRTDFVTCYFYCHNDDPTSKSAVGILKGLVDQLLEAFPQMLAPCYTRCTTSSDPCLISLSLTKKLFKDFCETVPKLFVIVDGLNECERVERSQVLDVLMEVVGQRDLKDPGKMRLLLVSRDYADIRRSIHSSATSRVSPKVLQISETDNKGDIQAYTRMWVDRIASKFAPFTDDMNEYLRNLTVKNAKGMFLYAKLVLLNLHAHSTRRELTDAIKETSFPIGLEGAYEPILRRIKETAGPKRWPKVRRVLGWLVFAKRTLTWKEIQAALSIDIDHQTVDHLSNRMHDHIYNTCGSLVVVSGDRVSLVHSTAKTYITDITKDIHGPSVECELATLCLQYLTFPCFEIRALEDPEELRLWVLDGHFAFQDYAIANWFHHVNAWVGSGARFLEEAIDQPTRLERFLNAIDDFMARYDEEDWASGVVEDCKSKCSVFEEHQFYEHLVQLTSYIYTFQRKGFEAQHNIGIKSLAKALGRNRKLLEEFPKTNSSPSEIATYNSFYDEERRYKCTRITCPYFSKGFKDNKTRYRHVDNHDRPFHCEVLNCIGGDGFAYKKDLEKHNRVFHPDISNVAEIFNPATANREKTNFACTICRKTFNRDFYRKYHELSHGSKRPYECAECGKAFMRHSDLRRHQILHRKRSYDTFASVPFATSSHSGTQSTSSTLLDSEEFDGTTLEGTDSVGSFGSPKSPHLGEMKLNYFDEDSISVVSNDQDIGSQAGGIFRTPGERYAVRMFGDFFGNLSELRPLHEKALRKLGPDRFSRNYRRVLKLYVLSLQRQTTMRTRTEDVTIRILRSRQNRTDIVRNIIQALEQEEAEQSKPLHMLDYLPQEKESIADWISKNNLGEVNETAMDTIPSDWNEHRQALNKQHGVDSTTDTEPDSDSDSDGRQQESRTAESLGSEQDEFEKNLLSVMADAYDFLQRDVPTLDMELRLLVLPPSLRDVVESVPRDDIRISAANDVSLTNRAKALVEDNTSMEWDWWPLRPRVPDLHSETRRLEWDLSWRTFYQEVSSTEAVAIQEILDRMDSHPPRCYCCAAQTSPHDAILYLKNVFQSFPSWIAGKFYSSWPNQTSSAAQRRYTPPTTTATKTASTAAPGIGLTPMPPAHLNNSGNTTSTQVNGPIYVPPMSTHKWLWIIFGIKNHPDFHAIENIEMSSLLMSDNAFFRELKSLESKHRWPMLKWFSPYIFSYCNFVQFSTFNVDLVMDLGPALPEDFGHEHHYEYNPRPPGVQNPLIKKHEFETYLRICDKVCFWSYLPFTRHRCCRPHKDSHKWKRIPRKKDRFDIKKGDGELAYGLQAVYVVSFWVVFVYHSLSIAAFLGFLGWWLKDHPDDLQNASVLLMAFLAVIASFWALPGRGKNA